MLTSAVKYVGVEGSWNVNIDNFQATTGAAQAPPAAAGTTSLFSSMSMKADSVLGTSTGSVL